MKSESEVVRFNPNDWDHANKNFGYSVLGVINGRLSGSTSLRSPHQNRKATSLNPDTLGVIGRCGLKERLLKKLKVSIYRGV